MSFWILVAALLALALVILLLPLLRAGRDLEGDRRQSQNIQIAQEQKQQLEAQLAAGEIDQAEFDGAYLDLQTALALELEQGEAPRQQARGKWMALVVVLAIPLASIALYMQLGDYRVVENPALAQQAPPGGQAGTAPQMTLDEMETALKEKLRDNPEDAEGWFMLGRTMMAKRQFDQAVTAFQRSNDLMQNEPGILFALADALAMQNNGNLLGEPEELVQRGLEIAPRFPNGLWLAGMAAEQRKDFAAAHRYWSLLLPLVGDNPDSAREIRSLLAMLEKRDPTLASAGAADAAVVPELNLSVDISDDLRSRVDPNTTVFVYAKAMQGPPMPLAVKRLRVADLPANLKLGDGDAMMPSMKLSSFDRVVVGARVSPSGNPIAQNGDFYTEVESVDSASPPEQLSLTIDRVKGEADSLADKAGTPKMASAGTPQLNLTVDIDAELRSRADPNTTVFVYAKAMQGPPMPLAVKRLRVADLPASLKLGDGDAMIPSMKLSSFDRVIVGARVSPSGNPIAQSGDFYTEVESVDSANPPEQLSLTIDRVK
ncbi:MAG: c-type cytochrome biogenesis protein CcmI [Gammaproteobacteria bacterium]|jgi:cytochrome c-type biogenesis protein CcmH